MPTSPEIDNSVREIFANGLWEVPHLAHKGISMIKTSERRVDPDEEALRALAKENDLSSAIRAKTLDDLKCV